MSVIGGRSMFVAVSVRIYFIIEIAMVVRFELSIHKSGIGVECLPHHAVHVKRSHQRGEQTDNIEVRASHCGMGVNPAVMYAVADRLARPEGQWSPFHRKGWRAAVYPFSGHLN